MTTSPNATVTSLLGDGIRIEPVTLEEVTLEVAVAGPADGELVILLHGFPESYFGWRHQIGPLAAAGYRVLAPNQRGYGKSDKPSQVRSYGIDRLAADVRQLIQYSGRQQAIVVGHDWGAAVAWYLAATEPAVVKQLAILNVPHPLVMRKALRSDFGQLMKSWYMLVFQIPWLPEYMASRHNFAAITKVLKRSSNPNTFSEEELKTYVSQWSEPGAYRSMLNWYRAAFRYGIDATMPAKINVPTLLLWGANDQFLSRSIALPSIERCSQGELVLFEKATHWLHHEQSELVNQQLLEFFATR